MSYHRSKAAKTAREPVQVYLTRDEKSLLDRLSEETGISRAEILRRGLREFGLRHWGESPMLTFLETQRGEDQADHGALTDQDEVLAEEYRGQSGDSGPTERSEHGE